MKNLFLLCIAAAIAVAPGLTRSTADAAPQAGSVQPGTVVSPHAGTIIGTVWKLDNSPVPHALVRLRNVTTGQVVMGAQADAVGRFTFVQVVPSSYVVELVDQGGDVLALGQTFAIGPTETVATFIRLGAQVPWYSGFFSNAAAAALASAASLGVTAVGNGVQPASARS